jgi:uncharacterized membrane protein YfcA
MELIIEFIIIFVLAVFQSVFGVGLLLFGTPTFLFIGYDFESTLVLLLPVSISISFLQIIYQKSSIQSLVSEYNLFCLPFLVLFLVIAINLGDIVDIRIYVSIFLIISSIVILNKNRIVRMNKYLLKYRKFYLVLIGSIHGFTNMGGGFLSLFSTLVNGEDRVLTRNYISYGYFVMGCIQYITILFIGLNSIDFTKLYYVCLPLVLFSPSQKIFNKIDNQLFMKIINFVALIFGIVALIINLE